MGKKFQAYVVSAILLGGLSSGCSVINGGDSKTTQSAITIDFDERGYDRIAENFVHTLSQLNGLSPIPTTIQMMSSTTPFGAAVEHHIIEKGYGHQLVNGDMGVYFLRYRVEKAETHTGYTRIFQVSIGDIVLEREFQLINSHVTPVSAMRIGGTDTSNVELNDDIFRFNNPNEFESSIQPIESTNPSAARATDKARLPLPMAAKTLAPPNVIVDKKTRSDYETIFRQYDDIDEALLPFVNDSVKLSYVNWEKMQALLNDFTSDTDIFSVVGCSLGKSSSNQSNASLSVSRTNRVKEALTSSGVSPENIYAESCWEERDLNEPRSRSAVVLTLKRKMP